MTELKHLLELALDEVPAGTIVVEEDLARGRRLLRKRTRNRMMAAAAAVAIVTVAAAMPIALAGHGAPGARATTGIKLVDYTGAQPPGYTVKTIPDHWVIQGSTPFALTIASANDPNKDPDVFIGKLVISQESFDTSDPGGLTRTEVQGHTAYYGVQDSIASLVIEQTPGRWLVVQAPSALGWTEQQEAQFGAGVTILPTAQESKG